MLSIKHIIFHFLTFLFAVLLVGCGGGDTKPEEVAPVEQQQTQPVIVETEEEKRERLRLLKLEKLGPNPYFENAPLVPRQAKIDFSNAHDALTAGDLEKAEKMFLKIVETYPKLAGASYNLAVLKVEQGDNQAALEHLTTALSRNNNHLDAHLLKAYIHRAEGDFEAAEKEYLETIELWGAFLPGLKNLGILYDLYMGKLAEALYYYETYNSLLAEPDRQILGWSLDLERQMKKKGIEKIPLEVVEPDPVPCAPVSADTVTAGAQTENATAVPDQPCIPAQTGTAAEPGAAAQDGATIQPEVPVSAETSAEATAVETEGVNSESVDEGQVPAESKE